MTTLLDELEAAFLVREVLPQGPPGRQGDKGDKGDPGRQGVKGDDGKDADPLDVPQPAETVEHATSFGLKPKVGRRNGRYALELHSHGSPDAPQTSVTRVAGRGPAGPPGPIVGVPVYVQDTEPTAEGIWLWVDTNTDFLWYNDGQVG